MSKMLKKCISILLAVVLVISMMPANVQKAYGDIGKVEVKQITSVFRSADEIPTAGVPVVAMSYGYLQVAGNEVYNAPSGKGVWHDSQGNEINKSYDSTGYCFEAGKEYYFDAVYTIKNGSYIFAESDIIATLNNVDSSLYRAEVVADASDDYSLTVRYTFTVQGVADKTIHSIVLNGTGDISEGNSYSVDMGYHNCAITDERWVGEFDSSGKFIADNSYTMNVTLTAKSGYVFADDIDVDLITYDTDMKFEPVQFFIKNDGTVLDVTYVFDVTSKIQWESIDVNLPLYYMDLAPVHGKESGTMPGAWFEVDDNAVYERVPGYGDTYYWYDEDGNNCETKEYQIGRKYYFDMTFRIKEEYMSEYEFGSNVTGNLHGESLNMDQFVKSEFRYNGSRYEVIVTFCFEAGFGKGMGYSSSNPAICYSYAELEYALEHKNIRYVAVGNVDDMLPVESLVMKDNVDPRRYAIQITGRKDLTLLGDATFTCPISMEYDIYTYVELITVFNGGKLNIYGPGSLRFRAGNLYFYHSVIKVYGGDLYLDGATIIGDGNADSYCYGINAVSGGVSIDGGATVRGRDHGTGDITALSVGDEGLEDSLSVSIWDGNFYVDRHNDTPQDKYNYGLTVNNDVGLRIYGGTFDGIQLNRYAADNLGEYIVDGSAVQVDEEKINPDNYTTINGKTVEVYKEISDVNVHINSPVGGEAPSWYTEDVYGEAEGCKVESVTWYENDTEFEPIYGSERFAAGNTYRVEIALSADAGVKFANPLTSATINYKNNVTIDAYKGDLEKGIVLGYDFGVCPNSISNVELTVTVPKENERPSYTVGCGSNGYYAVGGSSNYTDYRQWYVSDTGEDNTWTEMQTTDRFVAGKYYRFYVDIMAASGYEFPLKDVGTIQPDVSANVNGCYATVFKAYEQDPSRYITVQYDFGVCNDTIIQRVDIVDIDKPFPGNEPDYTAMTRGTGYYIDNTSAYDVWGYDNGVEIRYYYKLNGISWYDVDEKKYLYTHETFKAGHNYTVYVDLKIDSQSGFEFDLDDGGESKVVGCVNGDYLNPVQVISKVSNPQWNQYVECTFTWEVMDVSEVEVSGITSPTAGSTPDYEGVVGDPAVYDFAPYGWDGTSGFWWYDSEGSVLTEDDTFVLGESYTLEIKLVPKMEGQVVLTRFKTPVTATLNGMTVESADVMASSTVLYIYETYVCEEAPTGAFMYGTVISATGDYGDTTLELYEASAYGQNNAVPYAKRTMQGDNAEYAIVNVPLGEYVIKVSREGHATYEYRLTVDNRTVVHDVTLWLYGDGDHNGAVNVQDAVLMKKYLAGMNVEMDLTVANVNADTTVDTKDAVMLMKKLAGMDVELGKA